MIIIVINVFNHTNSVIRITWAIDVYSPLTILLICAYISTTPLLKIQTWFIFKSKTFLFSCIHSWQSLYIYRERERERERERIQERLACVNLKCILTWYKAFQCVISYKLPPQMIPINLFQLLLFIIYIYIEWHMPCADTSCLRIYTT